MVRACSYVARTSRVASTEELIARCSEVLTGAVIHGATCRGSGGPVSERVATPGVAGPFRCFVGAKALASGRWV